MDEINPFSASLPDGYNGLDEGLAEFLREQAANLRETHTKNQAGDTTFPVSVLYAFGPIQQFTLGSVGKFQHPEFGLIRARYVQFGVMDAGLPIGSPLGLELLTAPKWIVTNQMVRTNIQLMVGLGCGSTNPKIGDFGWALTSGPNVFPLELEEEVKRFERLTWTDSGEVGKVNGISFGLVISDSEGLVLPVGAAVIETSSMGSQTSATVLSHLQAEIDELKTLVRSVQTTQLANGVEIRFEEFRADLERQFQDSRGLVSLLTNRVARVTDSNLLGQYQNLLSLTGQFYDRTSQANADAQNAALRAGTSVRAVNGLTQQVEAFRDQVSVSVRSVTELTAEAGVQALESGQFATASANFSITAQAFRDEAGTYASAAAISAALAASIGVAGVGLVQNPYFQQYPSATAGVLPDLWITWVVPSLIQRVDSTFGAQKYAMQMSRAGNTNSGIAQFIGAVGAGNTVAQNQWFVIEAEIRLDSGQLQGSGILFYILDSSGAGVEALALNFAVDPDISGVAQGVGVAGRLYVFKKLVQVTHGAAHFAKVHLMNGWTDFIGGISGGSNDITWRQGNVRTATDAEIATKTVLPANIAANATAVSSLSTRVQKNSNPNLLLNPTWAQRLDYYVPQTGTWATVDHNGHGSYSYCFAPAGADGYYYNDSVDIPVFANDWYAFAAGSEVFQQSGSDSGLCYLEIIWYKAGGGLSDYYANSTGPPRYHDNGFTPDQTDRILHGFTAFSPPDAVAARCRFVGYGHSFYMAWRQAKFERGQVCTDFSGEGGLTSQALSYFALSSTVGGLTTTVTSNTSSIGGIIGKHSLVIDGADGSITGYELIGGGGYSDITFRAEHFNIRTGGGNLNPFSISGGNIALTGYVVIDGDLLINGSLVGYDKIAPASIVTTNIYPTALNQRFYTQLAADVIYASFDPNPVGMSIVINKEESASDIDLTANCKLAGVGGSGDIIGVIQLWRDGGIIDATQVHIVGVSTPLHLNFPALFTDIGVSAGSHTYELRFLWQAGSAGNVFLKAGSVLKIEEAKLG